MINSPTEGIGVPKPELRKIETWRQGTEQAFGEMKKIGFTPERVLIGNYREYPLDGFDPSFNDSEEGQGERRPSDVFICTDLGGEKRVFKAHVCPDTFGYASQDLHREVLFYQQARQPLLEGLPTELKDKIRLPTIGQVFDHGQPGVSFAMEFVDGAPMGSVHYEASGQVTREDVDTVLDYISYTHSHTAEWWREKAPGYFKTVEDTVSADTPPMMAELTAHRKRFDDRREGMKALLGDEYAAKMEEYIDSDDRTKQYSIPKEQLTVVIHDFNVGNFMKDREGKIVPIDPAGARLSDPAIGAAFVIESLWEKPELFDYALKKALSSIPDEKGRELLRNELMYLRLSGVAHRFYGERLKAASGDQSGKEYRHCQKAREVLAGRIKEAFEKTGVWAEFFPQKV